MPVTQTQGGSNRVSITSLTGFGTDNATSLFMGWFYPTALAQDNGYFGAGTSTQIKIAPTTTEIYLIQENNNINGEWRTTTAGITTSKWWFIAVLLVVRNATDSVYQPRVWVGDETTPPQEQALTTVASPTGNPNVSTAVQFGNNNGSNAFGGDLGPQYMGISLDSVGSVYGPPSTVTWTQQDTDTFRSRIVDPMWRGDYEWFIHPNTRALRFAPAPTGTNVLTMNDAVPTTTTAEGFLTTANGQSFSRALVVSGSTRSTLRANPRPPKRSWPNYARLRR